MAELSWLLNTLRTAAAAFSSHSWSPPRPVTGAVASSSEEMNTTPPSGSLRPNKGAGHRGAAEGRVSVGLVLSASRDSYLEAGMDSSAFCIIFLNDGSVAYGTTSVRVPQHWGFVRTQEKYQSLGRVTVHAQVGPG